METVSRDMEAKTNYESYMDRKCKREDNEAKEKVHG